MAIGKGALGLISAMSCPASQITLGNVIGDCHVRVGETELASTGYRPGDSPQQLSSPKYKSCQEWKGWETLLDNWVWHSTQLGKARFFVFCLFVWIYLVGFGDAGCRGSCFLLGCLPQTDWGRVPSTPPFKAPTIPWSRKQASCFKSKAKDYHWGIWIPFPVTTGWVTERKQLNSSFPVSPALCVCERIAANLSRHLCVRKHRAWSGRGWLVLALYWQNFLQMKATWVPLNSSHSLPSPIIPPTNPSVPMYISIQQHFVRTNHIKPKGKQGLLANQQGQVCLLPHDTKQGIKGQGL